MTAPAIPRPVLLYFETRETALEAAREAIAPRSWLRLHFMSSGYGLTHHGRAWLVEWRPTAGGTRVLTSAGWVPAWGGGYDD
jgi:hypothetical protein